MRIIVLLLLLTGSLLAQRPRAADLMRRAFSVASQSTALLSDYVYSERIEKTSLPSGRLHSRVVQHLFLNGRPVVERDGKFHSADKSRKQYRLMLADVAQGYEFRLAGSDGGCWKIAAAPKPGWQGHSAIRALLPDLAGTIWIDKSSGAWVRIEAHVLHDMRLGLFLGSMAAGSHIDVRESLMDGELWHVDRVDLRLKARALWKRLNCDYMITYYGFRKFRVDSSMAFAKR